jgi:hypothetical protein
MRLNRILAIVVLALLIGLFFVSFDLITDDIKAQPVDPSLSVKIIEGSEAEFTPGSTVSFKVQVEYLKKLPTSQTAFVTMRYDIVEDPLAETNVQNVNKSVDLTIVDPIQDITFNINVDEELDLSYGDPFVIKFTVRETNETGEWQDAVTTNIRVGAYYEFSLVGVEIDKDNLKEGELIDIDVTVKNDGNHEFPIRVVAFVDGDELTYEEDNVGMGETKTITVGWDNAEPGKHDVHVEIYAKIIEDGVVTTSEKLDESDPEEVEIEKDTER